MHRQTRRTITSGPSMVKSACGLTARKCPVAPTFVPRPAIFVWNRKGRPSSSGGFGFVSCR